MGVLTTPLGQALITLGTSGLVAIVATLLKLSGRMSRVEGRLELLIEMVAGQRDGKSKSIRRHRRSHPAKETEDHE